MIPGFNFSNQIYIQQSITETYHTLTDILVSFAQSAIETPVESTHQVRKKLKMFRAFVKLVKLCSEPEKYSEANVFLRDLGRKFSELRDAHVRRFLIQETFIPGASSGFQELLTEVTVYNDEMIRRMEKEMITNVNRFQWFAGELKSNLMLSYYFTGLTISEDSILNGYTDTFGKSMLAFQSGILYPDSEMMHEWRKRMKDVQYQTELLAGELNAEEISFYPIVVLLCDYLGEMNDLHMLERWVAEHENNFQNIADLNAWISEIQTRKNKLQTEAEELGNQFFQFSPANILDVIRSAINE